MSKYIVEIVTPLTVEDMSWTKREPCRVGEHEDKWFHYPFSRIGAARAFSERAKEKLGEDCLLSRVFEVHVKTTEELRLV